MTQKRQTVLQLTMLAIAMAALVILSAVGPAACAPAAPAEQASGQAEAEDATATATTDATNTPTPEPTGVSTETATPTPSPTPTPDPKLDNLLNIWAQGYEARQSAGQGASGQSAGGQSATQKTIAVQIAPAYQDTDHRSSITAFLDSRGIAHMTVVGNNDIQATVPVSLLATLTGLPSVGSILATPLPYPNAGGVNILIAEYEAGLLPGEDANPTFALLDIGIEGDANYDAVKRYLENNSAVMFYSDPDINDTYKPIGSLPVYVPVAQIAPVARMAGVVDMTLYAYPVPTERRVTQPPLPLPAATTTPTPTAAAQGGASPSAACEGGAPALPSVL